MGHVLEAMYDMHADPAELSSVFGIHIPLLEIDDVCRIFQEVPQEEAEGKRSLILECFDTPDPVSDPLTRKLCSRRPGRRRLWTDLWRNTI